MRKTTRVLLLAILACTRSRPDGIASDLRDIILPQAARRPQMAPEDLYSSSTKPRWGASMR